jgi:hypothetical protein
MDTENNAEEEELTVRLDSGSLNNRSREKFQICLTNLLPG